MRFHWQKLRACAAGYIHPIRAHDEGVVAQVLAVHPCRQQRNLVLVGERYRKALVVGVPRQMRYPPVLCGGVSKVFLLKKYI
jgi:hypothetical protein